MHFFLVEIMVCMKSSVFATPAFVGVYNVTKMATPNLTIYGHHPLALITESEMACEIG